MKAPQSVSFVQPLLSRGEEIKAVDAVVAYYCLYSAVRQVLETKLHTKDPEVADFATALLNEIESIKSEANNQDILEDDDASRAHVLNFASAVFSKADRATQLRRVNKSTGAGFAAAAVFLGLEAIWGEIDAETMEKIKFSKFQATRILKAIRDGQDPNDLFPQEEKEADAEESVAPEAQRDQEEAAEKAIDSNPGAANNEGGLNGVPAEDTSNQNEDETEDIDNSAVDLPEPPRSDPATDLALPHAPKEDLSNDVSLPPPPATKPEGNVSPPPPVPPKQEDRAEDRIEKQTPEPAPKPKQIPSHPVSAAATSNQPTSPAMSPEEIIALTTASGSAQKHAKYAMSALNYDDINTAITELERALDLLRVYQKNH